jgi:thiol-disulfide isomerase/thioredoxin
LLGILSLGWSADALNRTLNRMKAFRRAGIEVAALGLLAAWIAGCGQGKNDPPEAATTPAPAKVAKADVPVGDADLLLNAPIGPAATNTALIAGDQAWKEVLVAMRPPSYPPEWENTQPSKEAIAEFERKNGIAAAAAADKVREFYAKFPQHEMAGEARTREQYLLGVAIQLGNTNAITRLNALEEARLKDPSLSEDERVQLRIGQLQRAAISRRDTEPDAGLAELEKGARALMKEFPKRSELAGLLVTVAQGWLDQNQPEKARALAQELVDSKPEADVLSEAEALLKRLNRVGKPLALKFKAVDGREVDVQSMKGKVVLVDFWATWCGPCMAELPKVKDAYEKLKPKGFEIIGVSLDREQEELEKVLAREKMTWPQCFDGGDGSKLAESFEIASIPTMWLVDKKGNLRDLNAREDLAGKVEKLLAE